MARHLFVFNLLYWIILLSNLHISDAYLKFTMHPIGDVKLLAGEDVQIDCSVSWETSNINDDASYADATTSLSPGKTTIPSLTTPPPIIVSDLRITRGGDVLPPDIFTYDEPGRRIVMIISNTSISDSGLYQCYYGNSSLIQSVKSVQIGEPPGTPYNITCISNNLIDMSCSFSIHKASTLPIRWTMYFSIEGTSSRNCSYVSTCLSDPVSSPRVYQCSRIPTSSFCPNKRYMVQLLGKNEDFNFNTSTEFSVTADKHIVKPAPVTSLQFNYTKDAMEVTLEWGFPDGLPRIIGAMDYRIKAVPTFPFDKRMHIHTTSGLTLNEILTLNDDLDTMVDTYTLTSLIPDTHYEVTVEARPGLAQGDQYWSEPVGINFTTLMTAPLHAPEWTAGSVVLMDCGKSSMCPVIYWKNPETQYLGGEILGYRLEISAAAMVTIPSAADNNNAKYYFASSVVSMVTKQNSKETIEDSMDTKPSNVEMIAGTMTTKPSGVEKILGFRSFTQLSTVFHKADNVSLYLSVFNEKGYSENSRQLLVPDWEEASRLRVSIVTAQIDSESDSVLVTWDVADSSVLKEVSSVTYFWCSLQADAPVNETYAACEEDIEWLTVDVNETSTNQSIKQHTLQMTSDQSNIRYGVAIVTDTVSGGLVWEKYRYGNSQEVPLRPQYTVSVDTRKLACMDVTLLKPIEYPGVNHGGQPVEYEVVYGESGETELASCPPDEGESKKMFPADLSDPLLKIAGLKDGTRYDVCVRGKNTAGSGDFGEPVVVRMPEETNNISGVNLGLAIGMPFGIVVIILLACLLPRCWKKMKKYKEDASRITLPNFDFENQYTAMDSNGYTAISTVSTGLDTPTVTESEQIVTSGQEVTHNETAVIPTNPNFTSPNFIRSVSKDSTNSAYVDVCEGSSTNYQCNFDASFESVPSNGSEEVVITVDSDVDMVTPISSGADRLDQTNVKGTIDQTNVKSVNDHTDVKSVNDHTDVKMDDEHTEPKSVVNHINTDPVVDNTDLKSVKSPQSSPINGSNESRYTAMFIPDYEGNEINSYAKICDDDVAIDNGAVDTSDYRTVEVDGYTRICDDVAANSSGVVDRTSDGRTLVDDNDPNDDGAGDTIESSPTDAGQLHTVIVGKLQPNDQGKRDCNMIPNPEVILLSPQHESEQKENVTAHVGEVLSDPQGILGRPSLNKGGLLAKHDGNTQPLKAKSVDIGPKVLDSESLKTALADIDSKHVDDHLNTQSEVQINPNNSLQNTEGQLENLNDDSVKPLDNPKTRAESENLSINTPDKSGYYSADNVEFDEVFSDIDCAEENNDNSPTNGVTVSQDKYTKEPATSKPDDDLSNLSSISSHTPPTLHNQICHQPKADNEHVNDDFEDKTEYMATVSDGFIEVEDLPPDFDKTEYTATVSDGFIEIEDSIPDSESPAQGNVNLCSVGDGEKPTENVSCHQGTFTDTNIIDSRNNQHRTGLDADKLCHLKLLNSASTDSGNQTNSDLVGAGIDHNRSTTSSGIQSNRSGIRSNSSGIQSNGSGNHPRSSGSSGGNMLSYVQTGVIDNSGESPVTREWSNIGTLQAREKVASHSDLGKIQTKAEEKCLDDEGRFETTKL